MAKLINRLTDGKLRKLEAGLHADGGGLYLQVRGASARSWIYRYTLEGKAREMGLGAYPATSLEAARKKRDVVKRQHQEGMDPIHERDRERVAAKLNDAKALTFSAAFPAFIADKSHGWKNEKHRQQWTNTLKTYAEPVLGSLPVQAIETSHVKQVLDPIWTTKAETASRVRGRIESVLDWCKALGYRTGENPAAWRGNLKDVLAARADVVEVEHHPALPYEQMPVFMAKLRALDNTAARALEWVILTITRANESLKALPAEVSREDLTWTVPKVRMKGRRGKAKAHRVPLPARAIEILDVLPVIPENPHLFPGLKKGKPLSDAALRALLSRMGITDATTHGFRATFKTWAAEETGFAREIIEKAQSHVVGDETEQSYDRGDLFQKRRQLMNAWAEYCGSAPVGRTNNVVPIKSAS